MQISTTQVFLYHIWCNCSSGPSGLASSDSGSGRTRSKPILGQPPRVLRAYKGPLSPLSLDILKSSGETRSPAIGEPVDKLTSVTIAPQQHLGNDTAINIITTKLQATLYNQHLLNQAPTDTQQVCTTRLPTKFLYTTLAPTTFAPWDNGSTTFATWDDGPTPSLLQSAPRGTAPQHSPYRLCCTPYNTLLPGISTLTSNNGQAWPASLSYPLPVSSIFFLALFFCACPTVTPLFFHALPPHASLCYSTSPCFTSPSRCEHTRSLHFCT
ncbi:hypothetical protein Pcinc_006946 [Petrolisthes cinctipes]|uniref:Uncharacterized protein n=1 Tax=Petrolisthes cinctipes TaxID=88211 RepID=A0AAE1KXH4_PETCI|nr:hypothetical protein Pcinc_006946 [Petrolisthes cinctipes]